MADERPMHRDGSRRMLPSELRAEQDAADAELGAALREALATVPPNVDLQVSRTGEVCLCDDLVPVTDATRRLAALLTRSATQSFQQ